MDVSVMSDEFHDWLDQCPVQWYRTGNGKQVICFLKMMRRMNEFKMYTMQLGN